jgi:hypothetical protein
MAAVVFLRPKTRKGREILERLEEETKVKRMPVIEDGTRRYYLDGKDADADAFDPMLDKIASDWRDHVSNSTPT